MIEPLIPHLTDLFNKIVRNETIPEDWNHSLITLLYKKGDPNLIDNYRPISLLPTLYKLFSAVLLYRITKTLDEQQPREQAGFRKGYSTIDHIFTLTKCIEKCNEYNKALYLAFVDYTKAFDSILHDSLWKSLEEQGIDEKYINILKTIYRSCCAKIKLETVGKSFNVKRGVKQGDPISPKLFTTILEAMFRRLEWNQHGININGEYLNHLRFADDIVILAESHDQLQYMLSSLDTESQKIGLCMNLSKTKVMTNAEHKPIKISGDAIEYVSEYVYLGQTISFQDATTKEVDRRVATSWKKYWANKDVFKSKLPTHLKKKLMDNTILPCLLYGCQSWPLTKEIIRKITSFQRATERSMLGLKLKDRVRCDQIRSITKVTDAVSMLCMLKWKWAGHVARTQDGRMERTDSRGGRGMARGREADRGADGATTWCRLQDGPGRDAHRHTWKCMEEAYTQLWVGTHNDCHNE